MNTFKKLAIFSGIIFILLVGSFSIFSGAKISTTLFFTVPLPHSDKGELSVTAIPNDISKMTTETPQKKACDDLASRFVPSKPTHTVINSGQSRDRIIVRFVNASGVRLSEGKLVSLSGENLYSLNVILSSFRLQIQRLYSEPEEKLEMEHARLEAENCKEFADMNLVYLFILEPGQDTEKLIDLLNALSVVEIAYPESTIVNP